RPVVFHRAVSGSFERFMAILIEHFAGAFPLWLAPEQVRVLPISDHQKEVAERVTKTLQRAGLRAVLDASNEPLSYRIRAAELMKVPYLAVVGQREADSGTVAVRARGAGNKQEALSVEEFARRLEKEARERILAPHVDVVSPASKPVTA